MLNLELHWLRDPVDDEVTGHAAIVSLELLHLGALEAERRKPLDVEEIGGAQMRIALWFAGIDAGRLDPERYFRRLRVLLVEVNGSLPAGKCAAHLRHHHVANREVNSRVAGVDVPGGHVCFSFPDPTCRRSPSGAR